MDRELLGDKREDEGNDGDKPADDTDVREDSRTGKTESKKEGENLVEKIGRVVDHFLPKLNEWLSGIKDKRNPLLITYSQRTIIWTGIMMYVTRLGSRRQIGLELRREKCFEGIGELSGQKGIEQVPHGDTVEYCIQQTEIKEFEDVNKKMIQRLIRMRVLEGSRLQGHYLLVIDGVHISTFDYAHCPKCVKREHKSGKVQWQHYKVQGSIVTPSGLYLPVSCEWIENEEFYDKQDCENKAAKRLIKKIREAYPQLKICALLDSLYASEPMFEVLEEAGMEWIVLFQEGAMPEVWEWIRKMMTKRAEGNELVDRKEVEIKSRERRDHQERIEREVQTGGVRREKKERKYTWINEVEHWENKRKYNLLTCKESIDGKMKCEYTWLVSSGIKLDEKTVRQVAQAGRCRWKIENEGNNVQKNGGYNLEHLYSRDEHSMKIWCILLDIAHIISQLLEHGSLIVKEMYGSSQNLAKRIYEHLCHRVFKKPPRWPRCQIRLFQKHVNFGWDTS